MSCVETECVGVVGTEALRGLGCVTLPSGLDGGTEEKLVLISLKLDSDLGLNVGTTCVTHTRLTLLLAINMIIILKLTLNLIAIQ